jgi:hypothetical protein
MAEYIYNIYNYVFTPSKNLISKNLIDNSIYYNMDNDEYTFAFNFNSVTLSPDKINNINKMFANMMFYIDNNITIMNNTIQCIMNLDMSKPIDKIELLRLMNIYIRWTTKYSISTKVMRLPDLEDGLIGCLFLYYSLNTMVINDDNFDNPKFSNVIMNIIAYANTIKRYNEVQMTPDKDDILNSLSLN